MDEQKENKKQSRARNVALTFRVTPEEKEMVERRMAQSGITNLRAYLLKQAIDGQVIHIELDSVKEMVRLLSNATNNLNQIARRVNQTGSVYAEDIADLKTRCDGIWAQAKAILKKLVAM
jgi:hypothetical protein